MEKVLLKNHGKADSHKIATYIASGGDKALTEALKVKADNNIQMGEDSGMRGGGGGAEARASPQVSSGASYPRTRPFRSTCAATPTRASPAPIRTGASWTTTPISLWRG